MAHCHAEDAGRHDLEVSRTLRAAQLTNLSDGSVHIEHPDVPDSSPMDPRGTDPTVMQHLFEVVLGLSPGRAGVLDMSRHAGRNPNTAPEHGIRPLRWLVSHVPTDLASVRAIGTYASTTSAVGMWRPSAAAEITTGE